MEAQQVQNLPVKSHCKEQGTTTAPMRLCSTAMTKTNESCSCWIPTKKTSLMKQSWHRFQLHLVVQVHHFKTIKRFPRQLTPSADEGHMMRLKALVCRPCVKNCLVTAISKVSNEPWTLLSLFNWWGLLFPVRCSCRYWVMLKHVQEKLFWKTNQRNPL